MVAKSKLHKTKEDYLKQNKKIGKNMIYGLIIILICVLMGAVGQIMLKRGLNDVGGLKMSELLSSQIFKVFLHPLIFSGVILYALSMVLWLVALSMFDVSFMYPLVSMGYIVSTFFAMIFLKENVPVFRWVGILLIVSGCFFILRS